jgi:hypothetical protein
MSFVRENVRIEVEDIVTHQRGGRVLTDQSVISGCDDKKNLAEDMRSI